jgi:hypothetical protein
MRLALVLTAIATIYLGVIPGRVQSSSEAGARDISPTATATGKVAQQVVPSK